MGVFPPFATFWDYQRDLNGLSVSLPGIITMEFSSIVPFLFSCPIFPPILCLA